MNLHVVGDFKAFPGMGWGVLTIQVSEFKCLVDNPGVLKFDLIGT